MSKFKIESGIPVPVTYGGETWTGVLRRLQIGESVFRADRKTANGLNLHTLKPLKFTSRVTDGGIRVWRIA